MARTFVCTKDTPVVQTKAGKLRGFLCDGIYNFHGVKYCEAKRFQQPTELLPWEGVKDALSYGFVCPMLRQDTPRGEVLIPHRYWPLDENCQFLNIWSKSLDETAKKPVLLWLHGGGFAAGSSIEHVAYDGANLCEYGDVVVVSLNHRLNILGYLDLSPYGEKYENSGNAGSADMVAALRWIHDNISQFGGDPENVTLFGQSGGGMKVWSLMQTPSADGLFHKGVVQSGVIDGFTKGEATDPKPIVEALLQELGFGKGENGGVEKLETVPYYELAQAYNKVSPALAKQGQYVGGNPIPNAFYLGDPREVGFTEHAKTIPLLVGTVFGEFAFGPAVEGKEKLSPEESKALLTKRYKDHTDRLLELFTQAYPEKHLTDLLFLDSLFRSPSQDLIEKKAAHPQAKTYSYNFTYEFPFDGGHVAWHCAEIPFVFHNAALVPVCNEPGVTDQLEEAVAGAWVQFAKTGDPNHPALPHWPACTPGSEQVMLFDRLCQVKENYDRELIALHKEAVPPFSFEAPEDPIQH